MRSIPVVFQHALPLFLSCLLLISTPAFANTTIDGMWKNAVKPAWLEITFESGIGSASVQRHDIHPKAVGLNVIQNIKPVINQPSQWRGEMYSAEIDSYIVVLLIATDPQTLVVYDISKDDTKKEILHLVQ